MKQAICPRGHLMTVCLSCDALLHALAALTCHGFPLAPSYSGHLTSTTLYIMTNAPTQPHPPDPYRHRHPDPQHHHSAQVPGRHPLRDRATGGPRPPAQCGPAGRYTCEYQPAAPRSPAGPRARSHKQVCAHARSTTAGCPRRGHGPRAAALWRSRLRALPLLAAPRVPGGWGRAQQCCASSQPAW